MTTPVIMDIAVAAVLLLFLVIGAHQGFVRAMAGLLITVVALIGAAMLSASFADPVTHLISPIIEEKVAHQVEEAVSEHTSLPETELTAPALEEFMEALGIDADAWAPIASRAEETMAQTGATVLSAVVESLTRSVVYAVLFILSFIALLLLLHILAKAMDLLTRLPGLHALNALGGAAMGLVKGALALFLAIWVLRRLGVSFETESVSQTYILQFFATHTPLSALSLLQ